MANYFIGDLQGCYQGLKKALNEIAFEPGKDTLWLTGDLIARGEDSLKTLKYIYKNQDHIRTVLGNHDLHFLAVANGFKKENPKDNLGPLLASKNLSRYIDWLRNQPLLLELPDGSGCMTHAGLPPLWSAKQAKKQAQQAESLLKESNYKDYLPWMYGNRPTVWHEDMDLEQQFRYTISAFTRMRFCTLDGELDFENKGSPQSAKQNLKPWFEFDKKRFKKNNWIFGHWASLLGETGNKNVIGLDTGYVWGNALTVLHLEKNKFLSIAAK